MLHARHAPVRFAVIRAAVSPKTDLDVARIPPSGRKRRTVNVRSTGKMKSRSEDLQIFAQSYLNLRRFFMIWRAVRPQAARSASSPDRPPLAPGQNWRWLRIQRWLDCGHGKEVEPICCGHLNRGPWAADRLSAERGSSLCPLRNTRTHLGHGLRATWTSAEADRRCARRLRVVLRPNLARVLVTPSVLARTADTLFLLPSYLL